MDKGRLIGIVSGFLLAIPAVILRLFFRFISLGSKVFSIKSRSRPACLSEPDLGVHKYSRTNGIKIHYVESGDSEKPLLLFVHGFPEFWFSWRSQIKHFRQNYRVVAMDTRGYNESDKPVGVDAYVGAGFDVGPPTCICRLTRFNSVPRLAVVKGGHTVAIFNFVVRTFLQFKQKSA